AGIEAPRRHPRLGQRRRGPQLHRDRPHRGRAEGAEAGRRLAGRRRPGRAERGVRRHDRGLREGAWPRSGRGQRQRRRRCPRPPGRRDRRATAGHGAPRAGTNGRPLRRRHDVRRWRPRLRRRDREGVNEMPEATQHFIAGEWVEGAGESIPNLNPATGQSLGDIAVGTVEEVDAAVAAARKAFEGGWSTASPAERRKALLRLAQLVAEDAMELGRVGTEDNGVPFSLTTGEAVFSSEYLEFF